MPMCVWPVLMVGGEVAMAAKRMWPNVALLVSARCNCGQTEAVGALQYDTLLSRVGGSTGESSGGWAGVGRVRVRHTGRSNNR